MDETPVTLTTRPDWWNDAKCLGSNPDRFFPRRGDNTGLAAAKAICAGCKAKQQCLDDAIATGEIMGVRGGLSGKERQRLMRGESRTCPTCGRTISRTGMGSHRAAHMRGVIVLRVVQ
jgi:WhiB family redox-sensing transcriptional regulator